MSKKSRWTPEEDAILREFYIPVPRGRRFKFAYKKLPGRTKNAMSARARYIGLIGDEKTRIITAFLEAAAEQGWHMRPDEATEEMALQGARDIGKTMRFENHIERSKSCYRAMLAIAPEFEVDK